MLIQTALATTALLSPDAASALTISSITRSSSPFPTDECGVAVSQDARALVVLGLGHDNAFWMLRQDGGAFEPTWRSLGGQFASGPALVRLPHGDGVAVFGSTAEGRVQTATVRPLLLPPSPPHFPPGPRGGSTSAVRLPCGRSRCLTRAGCSTCSRSVATTAPCTTNDRRLRPAAAMRLGGGGRSCPVPSRRRRIPFSTPRDGSTSSLEVCAHGGARPPAPAPNRARRFSPPKPALAPPHPSPPPTLPPPHFTLPNTHTHAGLDRALWHKAQRAADGPVASPVPASVEGNVSAASQWCAWESVGPALPLGSFPRIASTLNAQHFIEVYVRGPDRALWQKRQVAASSTGTGWTPWRKLGGTLAGSPTPVKVRARPPPRPLLAPAPATVANLLTPARGARAHSSRTAWCTCSRAVSRRACGTRSRRTTPSTLRPTRGRAGGGCLAATG